MLQEQRQHLAGQKAVEETAEEGEQGAAEEGVEEAEQGAAEETAEEAGQSAEEETAEEAEQGAAVFGWMWVAVVRMVLVQRDRG